MFVVFLAFFFFYLSRLIPPHRRGRREKKLGQPNFVIGTRCHGSGGRFRRGPRLPDWNGDTIPEGHPRSWTTNGCQHFGSESSVIICVSSFVVFPASQSLVCCRGLRAEETSPRLAEMRPVYKQTGVLPTPSRTRRLSNFHPHFEKKVA